MFKFVSFFVFVSQLLSIQASPLATAPNLYARRDAPQFAPDWNPKETPYPSIRRDNVSFTYQSAAVNGNVTVADPYNYLEPSSSSSKEVQSFIDQQNALFKTYLEKCKDVNAIRDSIKDASHYDELGFPVGYGNKEDPIYVYLHRELGSDFRGIYIATQAQIDQTIKNKFMPLPGKKVLDESMLNKDYRISSQNISPDGKTLLYSLQKRGTNDFTTKHLVDISSIFEGKEPKPYSEEIKGVADNVDGWSADGKGFFYVHDTLKQDGSLDQSTLMYHTVGTAVKDDIVFLQSSVESGIELRYNFDVTIDKKVLVVYAYGDSGKPRVYATELDQPLSGPKKWISISPDFELELEYLTNIDDEYYFLARFDEQSNQVVKFKIDFTKSSQVSQLGDLKEKAKHELTVIPEDKTAWIDIYTVFDYDKILLCYTQDAKRNCFIYELQTGKRVQSVLNDYFGTSSSLVSLSTGTDIFLWSWSYDTPGQLFYVKWDTRQKSATSELVFESKLQSIDSKKFTVEQRWAKSKDGTKIPLNLFYRKGIQFDGTRPVMLNFFGAYRVVYLPFYSPEFMSWVHDYDGIFAFAHPRGGGEVRGEEWHLDGTKANKQNTIDDINAVIEYLIDNKIAAKGKVIIYGKDAASTTSMAIVNQSKQGSIGVVTLQYGMYDLLRFPSDDIKEELEEYGDPTKPKDFDWLYKISPLHNVDQNKTYPAILSLPEEDIVSQWHGRKMIATLQHDLANNPNPFFYNTYDPSLSDEENVNNSPIYSFAFAAHILGLERVNH